MKPTKEQFINNAYAKSIRATCLEIAAIEESLLSDEGVDRQAATAKLKAYKEELMGLGITPNFKAGLDQSAYEDPAAVAEYVAGQWLKFIDTPVIPLIRTIDPDVENKDFESTLIMRSFINVTKRFLNYEEGKAATMTTTKQPSRRGFASLSEADRLIIASMGGQAAWAKGRAHRWTSEEAREAGKIGGAISRRRSRYFKEEL